MFLQVILLILCLSCISVAEQSSSPSLLNGNTNNLIRTYLCDENGYIEYLNNWSEVEKPFSRDTTSDEFKERLNYFKENCLKIHEWNSKDKYKLEFTYYADWSAEEFSVFGSTTQRYSGMKPDIYETQPFFNNTSYRDYSMYSVDPCDDVLKEGENSLRETISRPQNCSVSWAFAITNSIEYAVKKMYKEEYEQEVNIALSAQELIDCVGRDHGIENGCEGIPVAWGFDYVLENGIAFRYYYPHTNKPGECKEIPDNHKYHIAGYEKPEVYNKYGLFELLKKGPVAVTLGLDPEYFQFYQNDSENGPYFNTGYYRPSIYGVLLESNQYVEDGKEEVIEWPYFSVETRLRACDSLLFRLPILDRVDNANIGGIAGFAIRPVVSETVQTSFTCNQDNYPSIEAIPAYATELIFENNSYPNVQTLDFSRFTQLHTLVVKNGAFPNCYFVLIDNSGIKTIDFGDNCFTGKAPTEARRLSDVESSFTITTAPILSTLAIGSGSLTNITSVDIGNVSDSVVMTLGTGSLASVENIVVDDSNISQDFGNSLAGAIQISNPGVTVAVVIRPTLPPTTLPPTTQAPTQAPTTTQPPTTLPPTTLPPTTQPPVDPGVLIVSNNNDCDKLLQNGWITITVNEGLCNSMTGDLLISNYLSLESIEIKRDSLRDLNKLVISNNPKLTSIVTENGSWDDSAWHYHAPFENVKNVEISSIF